MRGQVFKSNRILYRIRTSLVCVLTHMLIWSIKFVFFKKLKKPLPTPKHTFKSSKMLHSFNIFFISLPLQRMMTNSVQLMQHQRLLGE